MKSLFLVRLSKKSKIGAFISKFLKQVEGTSLEKTMFILFGFFSTVWYFSISFHSF